MLLHKKHRFYYEGVSFTIPDGYYLDTNYGDGATDALDFWTKDKSLRIRIAIEQETYGPLTELNFAIRELEDCIVLEKPEAVLINGLTGYRAVYDSGRRQYCEIRCALSGSGDLQTEIMILFAGDPQLPGKDVLQDLVAMISPMKE